MNEQNPDSPDLRIRLRVMGISYSQIQSGAYALLLAQVGGPFRIPVVIGASEAQAIALQMESIKPPRPLTHDLMATIQRAFGIRLEEVFIHKFEDGVFYSTLRLSDGERTVSIDSRTSDACALAMRTGAPIFTTPEILSETGFEMEEVVPAADENDSPAENAPKLENYSIEELQRTLDRLIAEEDYEEAARVAEILKNKQK